MRNLLSLFRRDRVGREAEGLAFLQVGGGHAKAFVFSGPQNPTFLSFGESVLGEVSETLKNALAEAGVKKARVVACFGSADSWCLTTAVRLNRQDPGAPIEAAEIEKLSEHILQAAGIRSASEFGAFFAFSSGELQLIDSRELSYKVDGVLVEAPMGKVGQTLEGSFFTAFSPKDLISSVTGELKDEGLSLLAMSSMPSLLAKSVAAERESFDAVILSVGRFVTDVIVVFGGAVFASRPLFVGLDDFGRALSLSFSISDKEAGEKISSFRLGHLGDDEAAKIQAALSPVFSFWLSGVELALTEIEGVRVFPEKVMVLSENDTLLDFADELSRYPLSHSLPFSAPLAIEAQSYGKKIWELLCEDLRGEAYGRE